MTPPAPHRRRSRPPVSPATASRVRRSLLRWYDAHRRDLPWRRRDGDPYAQWVAEVMLQQTRVDTVLKYYEPFLRRFPSVGALAAAADDDVLKAWEGLGYYRRVLHLHQAARELAGKGLDVPRAASELTALPGVGEYTSAAIRSIAFGEPVAAVDGNVARVVARLLGIKSDVTTSRGRATVRAAADRLLSRARPGDFNQAWMDLGSAVCTPRSPKCPMCPLRRDCAARRDGAQDRLPSRHSRKGKATPTVRVHCCLARSGQRVLMRQRPRDGLWAGLWEFPAIDPPPSTDVRAAERPRLLAADGHRSPGGRWRFAGEVGHQLSHRLYVFHVWSIQVPKAWKAPPGFHWFTPDQLATLAMSVAHRKIIESCLC